MQQTYTFFWGGPFSQWYPATFNIEGIEYNCAEQYMMFQKALFFGDEKIAREIMKTKDPKDQKALGRKVKPFNEDTWNRVVRTIVYKGNYAKFTQNKNLLKVLLTNNNDVFVEASPNDKIWGIGLAATDPRAQDPSQWLGTNWLGVILTRLRADLKLAGFKIEEDEDSDATIVPAHIRKHMTLDENGKVQIEETLVPEREMMPVDEYGTLYCEKLNVELKDGVRIIHPDDHECYEYQNGEWILIPNKHR